MRRRRSRGPWYADISRTLPLISLEHLRGSRRLDRHLVPRRNALPGDHLIVGLPGAHPGVHPPIRIDQHLQKRRAGECDQLGDDPWDVLLAGKTYGVAEAVGLGGLDE